MQLPAGLELIRSRAKLTGQIDLSSEIMQLRDEQEFLKLLAMKHKVKAKLIRRIVFVHTSDEQFEERWINGKLCEQLFFESGGTEDVFSISIFCGGGNWDSSIEWTRDSVNKAHEQE